MTLVREKHGHPALIEETTDRLLPRAFVKVLTHRYLPVLGMTYMASVIGIAARSHGTHRTLQTLIHEKEPYWMGLLVAAWVSVPALIWILLKCSLAFHRQAQIWYIAMAGLMAATAILGNFLFPEDFFQGVRIFFIASIPVFIVQYILFVRGGMPWAFAWPLTLGGAAMAYYGLLFAR